MAKALRHRKPSTPPYFGGCYKTAPDGSLVQAVLFFDPTSLTMESVWTDAYDVDKGGNIGGWGDRCNLQSAVTLARAIARRARIWDGYTAAKWEEFAMVLLYELGDDWTLTLSEVIEVWRDVHALPPITPSPF